MLDVADAVDVQLSAGNFSKSGRSLKRLSCFGPEGIDHLLPADFDVFERLLFAQAGAESGTALVAAAFVEIPQLKGVGTGREIEVGKEERVIGDLAEGGVGDFSFPVFVAALGHAFFEHRERGLELALQNLPDEFDHGSGAPDADQVDDVRIKQGDHADND